MRLGTYRNTLPCRPKKPGEAAALERVRTIFSCERRVSVCRLVSQRMLPAAGRVLEGRKEHRVLRLTAARRPGGLQVGSAEIIDGRPAMVAIVQRKRRIASRTKMWRASRAGELCSQGQRSAVG